MNKLNIFQGGSKIFREKKERHSIQAAPLVKNQELNKRQIIKTPKTIAIANQKGGVGKTITALNLAHGLALKGHKTLIIDLDSQAALTAILLRQPVKESVFNLLTGEGKPRDYIIQAKENLFLLPGDSRLAILEGRLQKNRESILKKKMTWINEFDFIIVDCSPSLGVLTVNALVLADYAIIPVKTDYLSLQALVKINDLIDIIKEGLNQDLKVLGYLPCQYDKRRILDRETLDSLKKRFNNSLNPIRQNISLGESVSWRQSIFEYKKNSKGAEDYHKLVKTILREVKP